MGRADSRTTPNHPDEGDLAPYAIVSPLLVPSHGRIDEWHVDSSKLTAHINTQRVTSGVKILSFQHVPIAVSACETTSAESTSVNGKFPS